MSVQREFPRSIFLTVSHSNNAWCSTAYDTSIAIPPFSERLLCPASHIHNSSQIVIKSARHFIGIWFDKTLVQRPRLLPPTPSRILGLDSLLQHTPNAAMDDFFIALDVLQEVLNTYWAEFALKNPVREQEVDTI